MLHLSPRQLAGVLPVYMLCPESRLSASYSASRSMQRWGRRRRPQHAALKFPRRRWHCHRPRGMDASRGLPDLPVDDNEMQSCDGHCSRNHGSHGNIEEGGGGGGGSALLPSKRSGPRRCPRYPAGRHSLAASRAASSEIVEARILAHRQWVNPTF